MNEWEWWSVVVCCFRIEWLVTVVVLCVWRWFMALLRIIVLFLLPLVWWYLFVCFVLCVSSLLLLSLGIVFVCLWVQPSLGVRCDRRIVCCRFSYTSTTRRHRRDNDYNGGGNDDGIVLLLFLFSLCLCCVLGPEYLARREFSIFLWVNLV